jgi:cytochrome P450
VSSSADLLAPGAVADPIGLFHQLRDEHPVLWSDRHRAWLVTGHPEAHAAMHDDALSTDRMDAYEARLSPGRREALARCITLLRGWMLFHDEPDHSRLRAPVRRAFTPRSIDGLQSMVAELATELLTGVAGRLRDGETVDLVEAFALPLPVAVISDLFGLPPSERQRFARWSEKFAPVVFGATRDPAYEQAGREAGEELAGALGDIMEHKRRHPGDDLLSALVAADDLTADEVLGACSLLLFAGHDTTTSLLGTSLLTLSGHPAEAARWRADRGLTDSAVEELLRHCGPPKTMMRVAARPTELGGVALEAGQQVFLHLIGANRDPRVFDDPDTLRLDRSPNPHLAFGNGIHYCLGAPLARMEARVALPIALDTLPEVVPVGPLAWKATISDRSLVALPVRAA